MDRPRIECVIKAGRVIRKAGDFVGENMFSDEGRYPVSAYCLEDTLACGFSREQFERLVLQNPNIGLQIIWKGMGPPPKPMGQHERHRKGNQVTHGFQ